ncbi:MAG: hypothetical protein VXZ82_19530 [Planctomycetota bacterium]|nr:hypothetical protein [Planctomycetota bacterium]
MKSSWNIQAAILGIALLGFSGCGKPAKVEAEIDVEKEQQVQNTWIEARIKSINENSKLTDAEKEIRIKEIRESAEGQMGEINSLAEGQADERRGQGR